MAGPTSLSVRELSAAAKGSVAKVLEQHKAKFPKPDFHFGFFPPHWWLGIVIRNPDRKEIPQKTLIEAAQLAAFYSQGNKQPKAAVNYTLKKYVNKPKGSAPGLVRLASFKTILVAPVFPNVSPK